MLLAICFTAEAQQPRNIPRIGYLSRRGEPTLTNPDPNATAFRRGLRDLGYVEGKNILIDFRYAEGKADRFPSMIAELLQLKVDILVSGTSQAIRVAKQATQTIPIVMAITGDPVADGLINSLARPGGNLTGLTRLTQDLSGKRLELLKESVPKASRVGVLVDGSVQGSDAAFKNYESAARALRIELQMLGLTGAHPDLDGAFQTANVGRSTALVAIYSAVFVRYAKQIADRAIKNRLPSMFEGRICQCRWPAVLLSQRYRGLPARRDLRG
jgi:putative ABC transport system substrate-binding protein